MMVFPDSFPLLTQTVKVLFLYLFLLMLLILNLAHLPLMSEAGTRPAFLLIGIYFWVIFRPNLMPLPLVFLLGILLDILSGGLVGLNTFCFMLVALLVNSQRRFLLGQSWQVIWAGFFVAVLMFQSVQIIAYSLARWQVPSIGQAVASVVVSVLAYPLLLIPLMGLNRFLVSRGRY